MKQVLLLPLLILISQFSKGQPGTPDVTFAGTGIVNSFKTSLTCGAVQQDGKVIVAGYGREANFSLFSVFRYNKDGSPDNSFGQSGFLQLNIGYNCVPTDLLIQSDGKIIIMGERRFEGKATTVVIRLNPNGSIDNTFASNGFLVLLFGVSTNGGIYAGTHSIALQKNDQIVIGGPDYTATGNPYLISRFKLNGTPDPSFGVNGKKYIGINAGLIAFSTKILIQKDGKIILAGTMLQSYNTIIARCNADGSFDASFNGSGKLYDANIGLVQALAIQPDGKLLLASPSGSAVTVHRLNSDGTVDKTFGNQGKVSTVYVVTNSGIAVTSLIVQSDDKILTSALYDNTPAGSTHAAGLLRYKSNGTLDSSFASKGKLLTAIPSNVGGAMLSPTNNRIYAFGGEPIQNGFLAAYKAGILSPCDNDKKPPVIKCIPDLLFKYRFHYYIIPSPEISDNCGIKSIRYVMWGATVRSGSGSNASGALNNGTTYLKWIATDLSGNTSTCTTTIIVKHSSCDDLDISLFPNPTKNYFTVKVNSTDTKHRILIKVFNFCAKPVEYKWIEPNSQVQMGSNYPVGIYYFYVTQDEEKRVTIGRKIH